MKVAKCDFPEEYKKLNRAAKIVLREWIMYNLRPIKTINKRHTSYGLKHLLQSDINVYYTNDEFKGGMLDMGFIPGNPNALNWCFNVSERSINLVRKRLKYWMA